MLKYLKIKLVSESLASVTANVVKIICLQLDMLTWLMTNPFVAAVLIQVIVDHTDPFTYKLERCCKHLLMW